MSDISRFTGKFRARKDPNPSHKASTAKVTKSQRASLVCEQCRKSKLRCDRGQPCNSCIRRHESDACSYRQRAVPTVNTGEHNTVESRLTHLESLLKTLMRNKEVPSEHDVVFPDMSRCSIDAVTIQSPYVGSTHWSAILDDIHELKVALSGSINNQGVNTLAPDGPSLGTELIFGLPHLYSLQQVMSRYLPSKVDVDRYLSLYFQGETFVIPFIHTYHFQRQYTEFWDDPNNVNPLWLSILFSICCLSSLTRETAGPGRPLQRDAVAESPKFHAAAGQCLVIGEYHRPQKLALEALAAYAQCKNLKSLDPSREAGMILGMVVRMAYELGYHRDPDSFGSLSIFEGEMRRRFWAACKHMDIMISFQLGLPSNICLESCDTKSPRNLLDSDFDVDTQVLPESRPETDPTKLLWFIVKDRQITSFSKVCKFMLSFKEQSEADLHRLDEEIRQIYATIPDILRTHPLSESIADPPFLIITRLYIEFICLKNLCVLHRGYMVQGNVDSTKACVEAAKRLVSQFIDMYKEFSPGGQLHAEKWMMTNFTMNDFLLGVMVLCLVIHIHRKQASWTRTIDSAIRKEVLSLLEQSYEICVENSQASRDARRVSHALHLVLNSAKMSSVPESQLANGTISSIDSALLVAHSENTVGQTNIAPFDVFDPFNSMGMDFESIDWDAFDSHLDV
ncbi:short chain dehydrogenase [Aspergillus bombycis]|uniref:Short chain dehydrogenase n=1 Tax=Aspergillus bombycis TaxID=109264 RepID=A0A1F8AFG4_9EURO|nr:short chain dehydrogenase [Aspergillus bombycis]OGM50058.1 short chain dehydrogenase [Aspergillus bombycis]